MENNGIIEFTTPTRTYKDDTYANGYVKFINIDEVPLDITLSKTGYVTKVEHIEEWWKETENINFYLEKTHKLSFETNPPECDIYISNAVFNETIKTIQNLRTIHGNFTSKEIPDETIELILQSSIRVVNVSNTQA